MKVLLNSKVYETVGPVQRQPIPDFPENTRSQGQQERKDRTLMSSWQFDKFTFGGGVQRMDIDEERDRQSYWRSSVDTRWRGKIVLPPMVYTPSFPVASYYSIGHVTEGQVLLAGKVSGTPAYSKLSLNFAQSEISYWGTEQDLMGSMGLTELWRASVRFENSYHYYGSNASQTGIIKDISPSPTMVAVTRNTSSSPTHHLPGDFYEYVGSLHIPVNDFNLSKTFIPPIFTATYADDSPDYRYPRKSYPKVSLAHTANGFYLGDESGVWLLNLDQKTFTEKLSFGYARSVHNANQMLTFDFDYLMVTHRPTRGGDGSGRLTAFNVIDNIRTEIGLDVDAAVPTGHGTAIEAMVDATDFLFAATEPIGSLAKVWAYDRFGWHFMADVPSCNAVGQLRLYGDSLVPLLHIVPSVGGHQPTGSVKTSPHYIRFPMADPLLTASYTFAAQGDLEHPEFNAGLPEHSANWLEYVVTGGSLSVANRIEVYYGLDGAVPTKLLGIATLSGTTVMQFGDGLGVEGRSIQMMERLIRGSTITDTPILITHHGPVLNYIKFPTKRHSFSFEIDLEKTSRGQSRTPAEIVADLLTLANNVPLVPFQYGHIATTNVKLMAVQSEEEAEDTNNLLTAITGGRVQVSLAELI